MENKKKTTKKTVKKDEPIKSMFTPEELSEKAFDSATNMATSIEIVKEIYKEGGVIMMRSNKERKGEGQKCLIFCKNISSRDIYLLAIHAVIPHSKKLDGDALKNLLEKSKEAYASTVDMYLAGQDDDGVLGVKNLKKMKKLLEMLKEAIEDDNEDEDDN